MQRMLTNKQKAFVIEYLVDLNATKAAIRAGYSEKTAYRIGAELLQKTSVATEIQQAQQNREKRTLVTADYVLGNLVEIVERCMQRAPVLTVKGEQIQDRDGNKIWQFDARNATRSLELIGKHLGMFEQKPQSTQDVSGDLQRAIENAFQSVGV